MKKLFIQSDGKPLGPSSVEEIHSLISAGWLAKSTLAQYEGEDKWQPLSSMPEFSDSPSAAAPSAPPVQAAIPQPSPSLRKRVDLALFFWVAFRVALVLVLLVVLVCGGLYGVRHAKAIAGKVESLMPSRATAGAGTQPAAKTESARPDRTEKVTPVRQVRLVQLAPAPVNTAPAPWEQATQSASNAPVASAAVIASAARVATSTNNAFTNVAAHRTLVSRIDPKAMPFGEYDVRIIDAVQKRWFALMDQNPSKQMRAGRVVVSFKLFRNGSVANVKVRESMGDALEEYLCQQAVNDSQPFPAWPSGIPADYGFRELQFTFQY